MSNDVYAFEIGQLVHHRRYSYRGAIAGRTPSCEADDSWYLSNQTQPDRDQPWYHVLVHGGKHTTYVAEANLEDDLGGEQVVHPFARTIFQHFHNGRYTPRSNLSFPGSAE
ncbi:MAG: heat shock protein HspQ [Planctomycetota bacterium]